MGVKGQGRSDGFAIYCIAKELEITGRKRV